MNKYNIKYSETFYEDLIEILKNIKYNLDNEIAYEKLYIEIINKIKDRSRNPLDFEKYISCISKRVFYKIYVKNYTIFYMVENNEMQVKRILNNRRNFKYYIKESNEKYTIKQGS